MTLSYLPVHFHISFAQPAYADNPPLFVLRSVLGKQLHYMGCIASQSKCQDCMYSKTCAYSFLFETILSQQNKVLPGRDKGSHPFAFTGGLFCAKSTISEYDFTITLLGKAVEYLPYIFAAFVQAGKDGLFKNHTNFSITKVSVENQNIMLNATNIDTSVTPYNWQINPDLPPYNGELLVELRSPLRFKYNGKYGTDFNAQDFMNCLYRRMKTLCALYGSSDCLPEYKPDAAIIICDKNLSWHEERHYSARQKKPMLLGGVAGTLKLKGTFSAFEQNLLKFNSLFNAGKSTNFGLGQMDFWIKSTNPDASIGVLNPPHE